MSGSTRRVISSCAVTTTFCASVLLIGGTGGALSGAGAGPDGVVSSEAEAGNGRTGSLVGIPRVVVRGLTRRPTNANAARIKVNPAT
jgi:hypothetical protein